MHQNNTVAIRVEQLTKTFGHSVGIEDVSFEVPQGKILGFIGPSGCGKTTTVRLLAGIYKPTSGKVTVLGHLPQNFTQKLRRKIGYLPQQFALYPELTVLENLNFAASIYGMDFNRENRFNELLDFVNLSEHKGKLARKLSGGMKRRLSLAATLVHDPELVFLDEPTAGIDPVLRRKFWDHFIALQQQDRTLFVTTQYVGEAAYCDLVAVMANGRLLMVETPPNLRRRAYGGEVVDLHTQERLMYKDLQSLRALPFVKGRVKRLVAENGIRLVVEKANTAIPELLEWCKAEYITIESIEEYFPPFDDVFVELVKDVPSHE